MVQRPSCRSGQLATSPRFEILQMATSVIALSLCGIRHTLRAGLLLFKTLRSRGYIKLHITHTHIHTLSHAYSSADSWALHGLFLTIEADRPSTRRLRSRGRVEDRAHLGLLLSQLLPCLGDLGRNRILLVLRERKECVELPVALGRGRRHERLRELLRLDLVERIIRGEAAVL